MKMLISCIKNNVKKHWIDFNWKFTIFNIAKENHVLSSCVFLLLRQSQNTKNIYDNDNFLETLFSIKTIMVEQINEHHTQTPCTYLCSAL